MSQPHRIDGRGRVDRARPLRFRFDGVEYGGFAGDTLASALLANGVDVVARSVAYGRPRGVFAAGADEPNALVQLGPEPMVRATGIELHDGLEAESLAGKGRVTHEPDPTIHDKAFVHCDVLVVGGGPAGVAAAVAAGRTGARVMLVDAQHELGGIGAWESELDGLPEVQVLRRATAIGHHDGGYVLVVERRALAHQRLWHVRARRVVLATGAHERPLVFADNDRPGVMLAGAARTYVERFGVAPGRRAVVFTTNDSAYAAALGLADAGIEVAAIVDARPDRPRAGDLEVLAGHVVVGTAGSPRVEAVSVARLDEPEAARTIDCDLLAVSGGWSPAVHLFSHAQGRLRYDERLACFVPGEPASSPAPLTAGACRGSFRLSDCLAEGLAAGARAAHEAGFGDGSAPAPPAVDDEVDQASPGVLWSVPLRAGEDGSTHFVDLQRDATVADVRHAARAGMRSPEHVKRFTTIGTASDQGKTSGVVALGVLADLLDVPLGELAPTTFRPPYVPVPFGLLAGRDRGRLHDPVRVTPIHPRHVEHGAVFEDVGQWKRPRHYPRAGEDMDAAVLRECRAAREGVAVQDASTLGKIDVQGPDAAAFLNRIYTGDFSRLAPGACKYGVMCTADGMVLDDGVTMRLAEDRFLVTTTTGNAAAVLDWLEEWLQTEWPDLRVRCTSVTEQWATVAIVGPRSRAVLAALAPGLDLDAERFPWMTVREGEVAGIPARVARVSFSGELAFEVNVAGWHGLALWEAVMAAGEPLGITPYGTEAMHVLRAEKGFVIVGQETDGTVTPQDLGMGWAVSKKKGDFVGRRSHRRPDTARDDRKQLVGLLPQDPDERLPEGAQLVLDPAAPIPMPMVGHVTSSYRSAALGRTFALALVKGGRERIGETVYAPLPDRTVAASVTEPVFYDREGRRRDGEPDRAGSDRTERTAQAEAAGAERAG